MVWQGGSAGVSPDRVESDRAESDRVESDRVESASIVIMASQAGRQMRSRLSVESSIVGT